MSKIFNNFQEPTLSLENVLYDKTYTCPICEKKFKSKTIKSGKNRLLNTDIDLKPNYETTNPLLYDCIVCNNCGYAALSKNFEKVSFTQIKLIKEQISSQYKPRTYPQYINEEEAIIKYKLVLLSALTKKSKNGEIGYICLKIAWLYRGLKDEKNEIRFLKYVLEKFEATYNNETFPIFELDELTIAYIIATISLRLKDYEKATKWISFVILDRNVPARLKSKAIDLKELILKEKDVNFKKPA